MSESTTFSAQVTAYCLKTKQKNVPILNPAIRVTETNTYFVFGKDADGNNLSSAIKKEKALELIKSGLASASNFEV